MVTNLTLVILAAITIYTDGRYRKIYNKVLLPCIIIAFAAHFMTGGWAGLEMSIFGANLGVIALMLPYLLGGVGAGDVKLLIVFGALLGPILFIHAFIYGIVLGGLISVYKLFKKEKTFAYGIPLSIGAILGVIFK